jgi:hypothetical protein
MGRGSSTGKPKADVRRKSAEKAKRVFLMADMMAGGMLIYLLHYLVQFFVKI